MKARNRNNMFDPIKRMLKNGVLSRIERIEDNSKNYTQIISEVIEKLTLSYDENGLLYNVEGEDVMVMDLARDDFGRLESVLETNKVTGRIVLTQLIYDEVSWRLIEVIPIVLEEGEPLGYDEDPQETDEYEPESPDTEDIDLEPTYDGSITDYDWSDENGEGERM